MKKVNLAQAFGRFSEHWTPRNGVVNTGNAEENSLTVREPERI